MTTSELEAIFNAVAVIAAKRIEADYKNASNIDEWCISFAKRLISLLEVK